MPSRIASARALECRNTITIIVSAITILGCTAFFIHSLLTTHHKPGHDGQNGATGDKGLTGDKGDKGPIGPRGVNGTKGATGNQGPPGPAGSRGLAGHSCWDLQLDRICNASDDKNGDGQCTPADCRGPNGTRGPDGDKGIQGVVGPIGGSGGIRCWDFTGLATTCNTTKFDVNQDGACNVSDCTGVPCDPTFNMSTCIGPQGIKGLIGNTGARGPNGTNSTTKGATGNTGYACWDRNQNSVFDISTEDFDGDGIPTSADCRGGPGPNGPNGANGINGINGAPGPAGPKGDTGDAGPQGPQGDRGINGTKGPKGDTGPTVRGPVGLKCWDSNDNNACDSNETIANGSTCSVDSCVTPPLPVRPLRYTINLPTWYVDHWEYGQNYTIEVMSTWINSISTVLKTTVTDSNIGNYFGSTSINCCFQGYASCWNNYIAVGNCVSGYTQGWPREIAHQFGTIRPFPRAYFCAGTFTKNGETSEAVIGYKTASIDSYFLPFSRMYFTPRNASWTVPYDMDVTCTLWWSTARFTNPGTFG